ncbi:hypothetical protein [Verrucosispora sp. FIM060022]|uniref:hypothetical protein n=1 Tax=Verrucosispora sp. FIM060022 TaxID=1479020 RepID=UPI000F88FDFC|nr:hypothetical protein [Verrucosispora sp. FIM060022]RUL93693.1 hypothetical protein EG812_08325 [Verrucosispora sp. FIM060022]
MTATITSYRDLFANVRKRPRMWLIREDFACVVAFIEGCNQANAGTLLSGFQPWLVTQASGLDNHVWWSIVAHLAHPTGPKALDNMDGDLDADVIAEARRLINDTTALSY